MSVLMIPVLICLFKNALVRIWSIAVAFVLVTLVGWHTGIPGLWKQELDAGLWMLDSGRWTLDAALWTLDSGRWTLDAGPWTLDPGRWTLDAGLWTLDSELSTLNSRRWTPDAER